MLFDWACGPKPASSVLLAVDPAWPLTQQQHCHPQVRGSAESAKRTFLEKKGLTAAEIDEAFKRVPPEAPAAPAAAATSSTPTVGANNLVTYTQQPQQAMQAPQHMPQVPSQALVPAQQMQMMQPQRPPVHWSQVGHYATASRLVFAWHCSWQDHKSMQQCTDRRQ